MGGMTSLGVGLSMKTRYALRGSGKREIWKEGIKELAEKETMG